jgi:hypothetical protein
MRIGGLNNYMPVQAAQAAAPQAAAAAPRGMFNQDTFTPAGGQQATGGQGAAQGGQNQTGQLMKQMAQQVAQEINKGMEAAQKDAEKASQKRLAEAKERAAS